jgi:hypothetical protein
MIPFLWIGCHRETFAVVSFIEFAVREAQLRRRFFAVFYRQNVCLRP